MKKEIKYIYLAFARIDYEGMDESTLEVFESKEDAQKHIDNLTKTMGTWSVTYGIIKEQIR